MLTKGVWPSTEGVLGGKQKSAIADIGGRGGRLSESAEIGEQSSKAKWTLRGPYLSVIGPGLSVIGPGLSVRGPGLSMRCPTSM